ncbi:MAG: hypothetical protein WCH44_19440 [Betaproteobacteria bacterium]
MSSTVSLDQDALANLTPEEREAFSESEFTATEKAAIEKIAANAPAAAKNEDDDGDPNEILDANGKPIADTQKTVTDVPAKPDPAPSPTVYKAALPEDYAERVKDLGEKSNALREQFKAGDIDFDTFEAQNSDLLTQRENLTMQRAKAEISQEMTQQNAEQAWKSAINRLFENAAKTDGIDYNADQDRNAELDQFVKVLANAPSNADKSMEWFLSEAHRRVLALNGKASTSVTPTPVPKAQNRTPPGAPKSIAHIPGGAGPGDVGGEFAHLDAMDGDDLEVAIAKMTPSQREKFARS